MHNGGTLGDDMVSEVTSSGVGARGKKAFFGRVDKE